MKIIILVSLITQFALAQQSNSCLCPANTMAGTTKDQKPNKTFTFSGGQQIMLCGYEEPDKKEMVYSEFILQECGKDSVIDFWGAVFTGSVNFKNDAILIKETKNLPTGPDRSFVTTCWSIETIWYKNQKLIRKYEINHDIRKYTKAEIAKTLKEFEGGKDNYTGDLEDVMYRLFIAAISGDATAKKYFSEFKNFNLTDGAVAEDYKDLTTMLKLWQD